MMQKHLVSILLLSFFLIMSLGVAHADDEEFEPAYENIDNYPAEDYLKYYAFEGERVYYTSGKKNGFRVNLNNEESTDLTIGIVSFPVSAFAVFYMNAIGWWE